MIKRLLGLQLSSAIIGIIAIISFVTVYSLLEAFSWVNHSHDVIYQLHRTKDDIADCQTSVRESVFGEDKRFLAVYLEKSPNIEVGLDNLQWLTRDNERQQKNIYNLRQNVSRRLAHWRNVLELYNANKVEESQKVLRASFGENFVVSTRNLAEIIESEEQRLLEVRLRDYEKKSSIVLYGIPLLLILYLIAFNLTSRSLHAKISSLLDSNTAG